MFLSKNLNKKDSQGFLLNYTFDSFWCLCWMYFSFCRLWSPMCLPLWIVFLLDCILLLPEKTVIEKKERDSLISTSLITRHKKMCTLFFSVTSRAKIVPLTTGNVRIFPSSSLSSSLSVWYCLSCVFSSLSLRHSFCNILFSVCLSRRIFSASFFGSSSFLYSSSSCSLSPDSFYCISCPCFLPYSVVEKKNQGDTSRPMDLRVRQSVV